MAEPLLVGFVGGSVGTWEITSLTAVVGERLPEAQRLSVVEGSVPDLPAADTVWTLRGVVSHERYVERSEREQLVALQTPLGRPEARAAALIPIRKSAAWWELTQDERRTVLEQRSHHIAVGLEYLPAVARRLHHGRDLGEPFDFLTWFEFAPADSAAFDELVGRLRETEEWTYVEREVDIRLAQG